jgi:hypothetical protein
MPLFVSVASYRPQDRKFSLRPANFLYTFCPSNIRKAKTENAWKKKLMTMVSMA